MPVKQFFILLDIIFYSEYNDVMKRGVLSKILFIVYFIVGAYILEAVTFGILDLGFMPEHFVYNFSIILFIAILIFAIPSYKGQYIAATIVLAIQTIFAYVNYSLYMIYGDLFSFEVMQLVQEAIAAGNSSFVFFAIVFQLIAIFLIIAILGYVLLKWTNKKKLSIKHHYSIYSILVLIGVLSLSISGYFIDRAYINSSASMFNKDYVSSDSFLLNTDYLKFSSYKKFGTYGYFINLIVHTLPFKNNEVITATQNYFNNGNIYDGRIYDDKTGIYKNNGVFGVDKGNNVIVIMMESLEWFAFGDGTYDKDINNLSYELTPNVYSLIYGEDYLTDTNNDDKSNDSLIFKNFFAKSKTNISEGFGIMGNYPVGKSLVDITKYDETSHLTTYGYTMPYTLKNLGYTTAYVHSHDISFYSRNKTHDKLGFDSVIGKNNIRDSEGNLVYTGNDLKFDHWAPEGEFARNAMKYIIPDNFKEKPFYTFYLNVSSHGAYTSESNVYDKDVAKYYDYVMYGADDCILQDGNYILDETKTEEELTPTNWYQTVLDTYYESDPKLCEKLVYYLCGVVGLDEAIGEIINTLKTTKYDDGTSLYDKTTMLLYSDHYSYMDKLSHGVKGFDEEEFSDIELNTIPMIISSPGLKALPDEYILNDRFCSAYDVIPTLYDLLGVKFNENFYLGHSIFRPSDYVYEIDGETRDMVVYYSNTGGIFSRDVYTYDMKEYIKQNPNINNSSIELFKAETNNILRKINYLNLLNNYHLYATL